MKRTRFLILLLVICAGLLSGCAGGDPITPGTESTAATAPTAVRTVPAATETVPQPTEDPHSPLYLPGIPVEDVITAFQEVVLNAEFIHSGDPTALQKWTEPIFYRVEGQQQVNVHHGLVISCSCGKVVMKAVLNFNVKNTG